MRWRSDTIGNVRLMIFQLLLLPLIFINTASSPLFRSPHSALLHSIFRHYDKRVRPWADNFTAVHVDTTIVLGMLIEIQENEQVAGYVISHIQRWRDSRLSWDPAEFYNITELIVPMTSIWIPRLFVYNSMEKVTLLEPAKDEVRVKHTGDIKLNIPQFVKCTCRLSIEQFPFDTQLCAIALASPLLTVKEMDVRAHQPPPDSYFTGNAEWNLINVTATHMTFMEEGEYRSEVHYIFRFTRRPMFYIIVVVVPIFLISSLSIMGIFTPGSNEAPRSEKVSLGLGSLLEMTILLGIIADTMPKSNAIPLLGYYILSVIILCSLAIGVSTMMSMLHKRMLARRQMPPTSAYHLAFMRPRLSSAAMPLIARQTFTSATATFGGGIGNGCMTVRNGRQRSSNFRQCDGVVSGTLSPVEFHRRGGDSPLLAMLTSAHQQQVPQLYRQSTAGDNESLLTSSFFVATEVPATSPLETERSSANSSPTPRPIILTVPNRNTHQRERRKSSWANRFRRNTTSRRETLANFSGGRRCDDDPTIAVEKRKSKAGVEMVGNDRTDSSPLSTEIGMMKGVFEEFSDNLSRIQALLSTLNDSQSFFSRNFTKGKRNEMIEKEWRRVFSRAEYFMLVLFEVSNVTALMLFLQYSWIRGPEVRTPVI